MHQESEQLWSLPFLLESPRSGRLVQGIETVKATIQTVAVGTVDQRTFELVE